MKPLETRRKHQRKWNRGPHSRPTKHVLQRVNHRRLSALFRKLRKRISPLLIARQLGVSRAYIYMLSSGNRKPVRMREATAVALEAFLARHNLVGEAVRLAA
jgi:hypothetical protein